MVLGPTSTPDVAIHVGGNNHGQIAAGDIVNGGTLVANGTGDISIRGAPAETCCRCCGAERWANGACYYCGTERP